MRIVYDAILAKLRQKDPSTTTGGGSINGSGTLGYLAMFTPDGSTIGNSPAWSDGTNVGIGTITPGYKIDVQGTWNLERSADDFFRNSLSTVTLQKSTNNYMTMTTGVMAFLSSGEIGLTGLNTRLFLHPAGSLLKTDVYFYLTSNVSVMAQYDMTVLKCRMGKIPAGAVLTDIQAALHIEHDTIDQFRSSFDLSNYWKAVTSSVGLTTIESAGSAPKINLKGQLAMTTVQVGNAGKVSGDLYFDTAANALANSDLVCIRKV